VKLRHSRRSLRQIDSILSYVAERNPPAADRVRHRIQEAIAMLLAFPGAGHKGAQSGTREFAIPGLPYVIVYRVMAERDELRIAGVFHGAQLRPGQPGPADDS
jgi:addiction module RelE/StbE family toxin